METTYRFPHKHLTEFLPNQNKSSKLTLRLEIQQHVPSLKKINAHKCIQRCTQKGTKHKVICNILNPECIFIVKLFNQSLVQEQYVLLSFRYMQNTRKKAIERHVGQGNPAPVLFHTEEEREGERGRERETRGAGPTRWSSSQLHSREVTMASDKQSTIDHSSPRRRLDAGGRGRQETTEPTAYPSTILSRYNLTPLSFSFLFFNNLECH